MSGTDAPSAHIAVQNEQSKVIANDFAASENNRPGHTSAKPSISTVNMTPPIKPEAYFDPIVDDSAIMHDESALSSLQLAAAKEAPAGEVTEKYFTDETKQLKFLAAGQGNDSEQKFKTEPVVDANFIIAAEANKDDKNAEWQYDSSDESTSSDSEDESNVPDLNEVLQQIKAVLDKDERSGVKEATSSSSDSSDSDSSTPVDTKAEESDDETQGGQLLGQSKPPKTVNEETPLYRIPAIGITSSMKIGLLGTVAHIVPEYGSDRVQAVIQSKDSGRLSALDQGTVLCREDRAVIGEICETLGNVENPYYVLGFNSLQEMNSTGVDCGLSVYFVEDTANRVFTDTLLRTRGTDASNLHDEELDEAEIEFSDDEKEAAFKASQKLSKKKRNRKNEKNRAGRQPQDLDNPEYTQDAPLASKSSRASQLHYPDHQLDNSFRRHGDSNRQNSRFSRQRGDRRGNDRGSHTRAGPATSRYSGAYRSSDVSSSLSLNYDMPQTRNNGEYMSRVAHGNHQVPPRDRGYRSDFHSPSGEGVIPYQSNQSDSHVSNWSQLTASYPSEPAGVRRWAPYDSVVRSGMAENVYQRSSDTTTSGPWQPNAGASSYGPQAYQSQTSNAGMVMNESMPYSPSPSSLPNTGPNHQNAVHSNINAPQVHTGSQTQICIPGLSRVNQPQTPALSPPDPNLIEAIRQNFPHLLQNHFPPS